MGVGGGLITLTFSQSKTWRNIERRDELSARLILLKP